MTQIIYDPKALLSRAQAGAALRDNGYPVADRTLATLASRGGGPPYRRFGGRVLYEWGAVIMWAQRRLSEPRNSSAEADAQAA